MEAKIKKVADDLASCRADVGDKIIVLSDDLAIVKEDIAEILSIFRSSKGFFRVMGWFGKFIIWGSIFVGGLAAFWHLLSTGEWHK